MAKIPHLKSLMSQTLRKYQSTTHPQAARKYAADVVSGKIPSNKWQKLACQRFITEDKQQKKKEYPWRFNLDRAERACRFVEALPHVKGKWSGQNIKLEPWQCFIICNLFGWETKKKQPVAEGHHPYLRRFKKAFVFVPRKNGKTTLASSIGLLMLTVEAEPGAEVYCGATSMDQANEVFRPAKAMAQKSEFLQQEYQIEVFASSIVLEQGLSFFQRIIGKPGEGQSPYCAIHDEYHEHQTSEQVDSMATGQGARQEPLQFIITTAGTDISSPCKDFDDYTRKVLEGIFEDDRLFALHFCIDEGDNWEDFDIWVKVNPNYGVSVDEDFLKEKLQEAKQRATQQNINRCKHLNQWMNVSTSWMNTTVFKKCVDNTLKAEDFAGEPCYVGLDLARKIDMASRVKLFKRENHFYGFWTHYLPQETIWQPQNKHYQRWVMEGWLTEIPGAITDFQKIEDDLKADNDIWPIQELCYDPHAATYLIANVMTWLDPDRCVEILQSPANLSEPMKELEAIIFDGRFHYNGDPVLSWMMSNIVLKQAKSTGPTKAFYPTREKETQKIDGVIALIMALGRAMTIPDEVDSYITSTNEIMVL